MNEIDQQFKERNDITYINKHEVIVAIKRNFDLISETLANRSPSEQTIIGNFITVLESELKKEIKQLKEVKI